METKSSVFDFFTRNGVKAEAVGLTDAMARFPSEAQYYDRELWKKCVAQFGSANLQNCADEFDGGWRGEFWGKMMRGAALTYDYTGDEKLYAILCETVEDLLSSSDERKSSYPRSHEFFGWDMWGRKYVMLGLITFRAICRDDGLKKRIDRALCDMADYIADNIGRGKTEIYDTSDFWLGVNSCSVLEPFVLLYEITGKERYRQFAEYIIDSGMMKGADLKALIESETPPYRYPTNKAYELISCVEGMLEYGLAVKNKRFVSLACRFADKLAQTDFTIVGGMGCEGEFLDRSSLSQWKKTDDIKQETCVTVTFMKLLARLFAVTGEQRYVEAFERAAFNALYGAVNVNGCCRNGGLPFDSYSPLIEESRARGIGGLKVLVFTATNGCCAAIGGAGTALVPRMLVSASSDALYFNIYANMKGEAFGGKLGFTVKTQYPYGGSVVIGFSGDSALGRDVFLRIPSFSGKATVSHNGVVSEAQAGAYFRLRGVKSGDSVNVELDLAPRVTTSGQGDRFAVSYGPIVYAADERYTDPAGSFDPEAGFSMCDDHATASDITRRKLKQSGAMTEVKNFIFGSDGKNRPVLVPYFIAGNDWKSKVTVWLRKSV